MNKMALLAPALAEGRIDFGNMHWDNGGWWMLMFWGPVLLIGGVALVTWMVRTSPRVGPSRDASRADPLASARRILAERYARGELDTEEYRERVQQLN